MRKLIVAALAALSVGAFAPKAEAAPLAPLKQAAEAINPIAKVGYCEFYDPEIGDWAVFWVPGPCLYYGAPGYSAWLGRYYYGRPYWRGRLGARPWVRGPAFRGGHRHGGPGVGRGPGFRGGPPAARFRGGPPARGMRGGPPAGFRGGPAGRSFRGGMPGGGARSFAPRGGGRAMGGGHRGRR